MKKAAIVLLCVALSCICAVCAYPKEAAPAPVSAPAERATENPSSDPDPDSDSDSDSDLDRDAIDVDLVALTEDLAPIAYAAPWHTPSDIPVRELLGWYFRCVVTIREDDPAALDAYRAEGSDDLCVPADAFEQAVQRHFALDSEHLRRASDAYDGESQTYRLPAQEAFPEVACIVKNISIDHATTRIYFTAENDGQAPIYCLTLYDDIPDALQILSCVESELPAPAVREARTDGR